jgi:hypothetical protein
MALKEKLFKARHEKGAIARYISRRYLFSFFQWLGFHITGNHFYEIVPDTRKIAKEYSDAPRDLAGIDWRFPECEKRALDLIRTYGAEFFDQSVRFGFQEKNYYFRGMDALLLYVLLRDLKPAKIVEVGQGFSSRVALAALEKNAQESATRPVFISIDPYPRLRIDEVPKLVALELIQRPFQEVDLAHVLEGSQLVFIDSSHVFKFGSDVMFEMNQVYPRLPKGTLLHVHDIFSPYEYPREWLVEEKRFWNEQYFLECFLMFNGAFEVHMPVNLLVRQSTGLKTAVEGLRLDEKFKFAGCSFYLKRV